VQGTTVYPDPRVSRTVTARVSVHAPDIVSVACLTGPGLAAFTVQPLPGGNILLVGPSPQRRPEILPRNAVVYDAGGHVLAEEALGDGIQHVLADSTGAVWVGYSDEGVFGDDPLGACGLIRFTPDLTPAWRYPSDDNPFGPIDDCEALNVDGATAWTCYDSGYPIVRMDEGILTGWRNHVTEARALAVDGSRAALCSGYGSDHDRLAVGLLQNGDFQVTGEYRLVLPSQAALPVQTEVIGRGPCLHLLTDDDWYQLTISDLPSAMPARPSTRS
jgi:hypothetical protein